MLRSRTLAYLLTLGFTFGGALVVETPSADAGDRVAMAKKKKKKKKKKAPKPAAPAKAKLSADEIKARAELMGAFTWGMSKEEVIKTLSKQLDERYAEKIADTTDVYKQDKLRKAKSKELKKVKKSFVAFTEEAEERTWDVSIIDQEFKRGVDESMLMYWENAGGKNQRRFFFFDDQKLYKMFIQIDVTQFEEDQQNFEFFGGLMKSRMGDNVTGDLAIQSGEDIWVRAIDKSRRYDAFCIVLADSAMLKAVYADRKERVKVDVQNNSLVDAITEKETDDGPALNANKDAVKDVIKGQ